MDLLSTVSDPEIPAVSIVELGIVRNVELLNGKVTVTITPTYSGCPAMKMIENEITRVLSCHGFSAITVTTVFSPAWTTDWIGESAREKLKKYGISPPHPVPVSPFLQIDLPVIHCPHCNSGDTEIKSQFGSTACKAYYFCRSCRQAFEYFKAF
jgi:ring-1,2-phenylacetyl-CoA epoxidase subunit PaaD